MEEAFLTVLQEVPLPVGFLVVGYLLGRQVLDNVVPTLREYVTKQQELLDRLIEAEKATKTTLERLLEIVNLFDSRLQSLEDAVSRIHRKRDNDV